jgi:hypothetical protein
MSDPETLIHDVPSYEKEKAVPGNAEVTRDSSASIATRPRVGRQRFDSWHGLFLFATASRLVLRPTQPRIQNTI